MNFMDRLKGEQDIIALCESFALDKASSKKIALESVDGSGEGKVGGDDVFNPDDLFNTVDLPEDTPAEAGPSYSAEDIELTTEQKEEIKKELISVLDKIQDKDRISEPALEMIVNEVANDTAYLSEAEEANLEGPVEKAKYRVGMVEAIKKFIGELLGVTVENDGEVPDNVDDLGGEGAGEGEGAGLPEEGGEGGEGAGLPEGGEGAGEGAEGGEGAGLPDGDGDSDDKGALQEGAGLPEEGSATGEGDDKGAPIGEGVCTECDGAEGGVLEVDPSEVIQVIDDNDPAVTPISEPVGGAATTEVDGLGLEGGIGGEEGGLSDDTPLTVGALKELLGKVLTEGVEGQKSFAELWKSLAGNGVVLSKPNTKGEQKTADPKGKAPEGTSYSTVKDESGNSNTLTKPNTKGEQKTADPKGKAPEGTSYQTPSTPSASSASVAKKPEVSKEEAAKIAAAVLHEGEGKSALSFLQEATDAIKNAKKSLNA